MTVSASRAKWLAGGCPLERRVGPHSVACTTGRNSAQSDARRTFFDAAGSEPVKTAKTAASQDRTDVAR